MYNYCDGCSSDRTYANRDQLAVHKALVIAGSISTAQRRTMKFEVDGLFGFHPENACDLIVNVGSKALLSFLDEDRPVLALDTWHGITDSAKCSEQLTRHHYIFNVIAVDESTDREIQQRMPEKIYGIPTYIISRGSIALREYDPDGTEVISDIRRL